MFKFEDYNPLALFIYFMSVALLIMFSLHPYINIASFIINILMYLYISKDYKLKSHIYYIFLFVFFSVLNMFFYHDGVTVLFFLNDNPMTLEALLYGVNQSLMIFSTIYLFRTFTFIFTSDKLLYVFSHFSNKIALMLSIVLRYVSLFKIQFNKIEKVYLGIQGDDKKGFTKKLKSYYLILSVMVTWAIENGIVTSDSMQARAYDTGKRTTYYIFKFKKEDYFLIAFSLLSFILILSGKALDAFKYNFYPKIEIYSNIKTYIFILLFILLNFIGIIIDLLYFEHWNKLVSQIENSDTEQKNIFIHNMINAK